MDITSHHLIKVDDNITIIDHVPLIAVFPVVEFRVKLLLVEFTPSIAMNKEYPGGLLRNLGSMLVLSYPVMKKLQIELSLFGFRSTSEA